MVTFNYLIYTYYNNNYLPSVINKILTNYKSRIHYFSVIPDLHERIPRHRISTEKKTNKEKKKTQGNVEK